MKPLAIDLFCGMFGWSEGLISEGWRTIGFDLEDMRAQFGFERLPDTQLVIQDVLTLHGSQFRSADLIVASPPCQAYSYRAMPWKRAKALPPPNNTLFEACFRIQREACEAAGRHIPLIVENVRGAQPWVGRARWNYGSFYLWGDVPALMPPNKAYKGIPHRTNGHWTNPAEHGLKCPGINLSEVGFNVSMARQLSDELKGSKYERTAEDKRRHSSKSTARKMASAMIAKIPLPLSRHIARTFKP